MLKPFIAKLIQRRRPGGCRGRRRHGNHHDRAGHPGPNRRLPGGAAHEGRNGGRNHRQRPRHAQPGCPRAPSPDRNRCWISSAPAATARTRFNISTAAAFVIAGSGRKVAKHGNRAASSRCGSADVLAALGVNIDLSPEQVAQPASRKSGIGFLFAPRFHPAMKHAIGPRRELGQRTIFNILGPLTNPAGANHSADRRLRSSPDPTPGRGAGRAGQAGRLRGARLGRPGRTDHQRTKPRQPPGRRPGGHLHAGRRRLRAAPAASADDLRGGDPAENAVMLRAILTAKTAARAGTWCCSTPPPPWPPKQATCAPDWKRPKNPWKAAPPWQS